MSDFELSFAITAEPLAVELEAISGGLTAFNEADVGPAQRLPLAVVVRDEDDPIVAGISGYTAWGWLYIQWLWVADDFRKQGVGSKMLVAAEAEAAQRGCENAWIDTFNPNALRLYQRQGYTAFGQLDYFPAGRARTFLKKRLAGA